MDRMEKAYYDKWLEQVKLNKELKLKIEKYEKIFNEDKLFKNQYLRYKRCFQPLANKYSELYSWGKEINDKFIELVNIFNEYILLNQNFNVKLSESDKSIIIKKSCLVILQYLKMQKLPKEYALEWVQDLNSKTIKTSKKEFERKNFIIKKGNINSK